VIPRKNNKELLIILLSLIAATAVSAAPTMCGCNKNFVTGAVLPASNAHALYISETSQITKSSNSRLAAIGVEILKPPADFTDFLPVDAKTLPPVPAALFMVLTGFLCVSLVKDRRLWLAAIAGLLWAGQAAIQAIPQLAANISKKHIQRKSHANTACLYRVEDFYRLRSDIEGTQYIGLLHHLAGIPAGTISSIRSPISLVQGSMSFLRNLSSTTIGEQQSRTTNQAIRRIGHQGIRNRASRIENRESGIETHSSFLLNPAVICPAARAEQYICFSPAFIFSRLARGPPNFT